MIAVFFGTSEFAVPIVRALAERTELRAVVTQPDRPSGRGQRLRPTPVKAAALELGLRVFEPERLHPLGDELRAIGADLFAVASYGKILPRAILDVPPLGSFNVHPSLLPLYRGATPLQAQIRDMRTETGVTIIAMDAGMDTGDILLQERSPLGSRENYGELEARLAADGARLLVRAIELAQRGELPRTPQAGLAPESEIEKTLTRPLRAGDLLIDWTQSAVRIDALIRSLSPKPAARGDIEGQRCKILAAHPVEGSAPRPPGTAWRENGLFVACGTGALAIERLIPPNRAVMSGAAF